MKTTTLKALLVTLLLAAPALRAEPNCWAANVAEPMSNDGLPIGSPLFQPLRAVMDAVEAMARPNPGLLALPEVRLRIKRAVMDAMRPGRMPREAVIHAHGFGPKAWGRGGCPQPPRPAARCSVLSSSTPTFPETAKTAGASSC